VVHLVRRELTSRGMDGNGRGWCICRGWTEHWAYRIVTSSR
jgi:hypothetical protein